MTGADLQTEIKRTVNDTTNAWSDDAYLDAINYAITDVSKIRADKGDADFCFQLTIVNGQTEPADFYKFCGTFPVWVTDYGTERKWFFSGTTQPTVKYFRLRPRLTSLSDTIYFNDHHIEALKKSAKIYLEEQRGTYNTTQEEAHKAEFTS